MRTRTIPGIIAMLVLGMNACGGDGGHDPNPVPGNLTVALLTAPSSPGALLFTVGGGPITGVSASGGYHLYETALTQNSRRVLLTGSIISGDLITIAVPNIHKAASYSVTVNQVAAPATDVVPYAQLATSGFSIDVQ